MAKAKKEEDNGKKVASGVTAEQIAKCQEGSIILNLLTDPPQQIVTSMRRTFESGSAGWNINAKIIVGGLPCQVSGNIIIIGSKPKV